jgi:23S rRNA pseudouridine2605 synthase
MTSPATVRVLEAGDRKTWLALTLAEGKNRQVRRMCEAVGLPVEKLVRVALGPLTLGKLPPGAWRHLEANEVTALRALTASALGPSQPRRGVPPRRRSDEDGASAPASSDRRPPRRRRRDGPRRGQA